MAWPETQKLGVPTAFTDPRSSTVSSGRPHRQSRKHEVLSFHVKRCRGPCRLTLLRMRNRKGRHHSAAAVAAALMMCAHDCRLESVCPGANPDAHAA